ncbi:hypothetical protein DO97_14460 [Neosynechococcus sphagnicola sy1]|uniref:Uncharacterized protein n=2 Tax=Neosynechococcus TaxID=1501143 RepID=A0A098TIT6_9CYAN|nr:hypothetical protein DO97_14460 [Neosynechococcus sphagnicola sy1]
MLWIKPILVPLCFIGAWGLTSLVAWSLGTALRDGLRNAQRMHQIPCARCQFFTGDYHLKCTVHPKVALSESAIHCPDYRHPSPTTTQLYY